MKPQTEPQGLRAGISSWGPSQHHWKAFHTWAYQTDEQICCCTNQRNKQANDEYENKGVIQFSVSERNTPFCVSQTSATGWFIFQKAHCLYSRWDTESLEWSAPPFHQCDTFKKFVKNLITEYAKCIRHCISSKQKFPRETCPYVI